MMGSGDIKPLKAIMKGYSKLAAIQLTIITFTISLVVFITAFYFHVNSNVTASFEGMRSYLAQNISIDKLETMRQLNSLLKADNILGYWIQDLSNNEIVNEKVLIDNLDINEASSEHVTLVNGSIIIFKKFILNSANKKDSFNITIASNLTYLPFFISLIFSIILSSIFYLLIIKRFAYISKKVSSSISAIIPFISNPDQDDRLDELNNFYTSIYEINYLKDAIIDFTLKLKESEKKLLEQEKEVALSKLARQVHHNLQHDLLTLNRITRDVSSKISLEQRNLLRGCINSVIDTVNNLKTDNKSSLLHSSSKNTYLNMMLEYLVSRLRTNWKTENVEILYSVEQATQGMFVNMAPHVLSSIVSNIVKNAIEACKPMGKDYVAQIIISLIHDSTACKILIRDNGIGISSEIKDRIFDEGFSHNKQNGSGIGLSHAKQVLERARGAIEVSSEAGKGSTFTLTIPLAQRPKWYIDRILVKHKAGIIVIDDEYKYYKSLKERFDDAGITSHYFSSKEHFETSLKNLLYPLRDYIIIVDYEFTGQRYDGFEIIAGHCLFDNAIMMTNMADEQHIMDKCKELEISLIPKKLGDSIIIEKAKRCPDHLKINFLDDDNSILNILKKDAKLYGLKANFFSDAQEMVRKVKENKDRDAIFFIDFSLNKTTGDVVTTELFELGFNNLHILTGYDVCDLPPMYNVKSISNKGFPRGILDTYL